MAADSSSLRNPSKPQKHQHNAPQSPSPSSSFIYKAAFVCVLIALAPIFPSGSPEPPTSTKNKTALARGLELLHLILVGVAISYGLFSRRNSDHPPELYNKEAQTWNYCSQYNPEEPLVVVDATRDQEPLFLPVRSLKPAAEGDRVGKECTVLPSPIPWRSRSSGRREVEEEPTPAFGLDAEMGPSEDSARKKSFQKSSPPPAPPPPPPPPLGRHRYHLGVEKKDGRKSSKDEVEEHLSNGLGSYGGRSVRTVRPPRNESPKRNELGAKTVTESDSEEDDDSESSAERAGTEEEENEVDKKADEFIARFREQIRLQRIASLKRLAEQRTQSDS